MEHRRYNNATFENYGSVFALFQFSVIPTAFYFLFFSEFVENSTALAQLDRNWDELAPLLLNYVETTGTQKDKDFVSSVVRKRYLGAAPINNSTVPQLIQMEGDRQFLAGITHFAKTVARVRGSQPVFMYQYGYKGEYSLSQVWSNSSVKRGKFFSSMRGSQRNTLLRLCKFKQSN